MTQQDQRDTPKQAGSHCARHLQHSKAACGIFRCKSPAALARHPVRPPLGRCWRSGLASFRLTLMRVMMEAGKNADARFSAALFPFRSSILGPISKTRLRRRSLVRRLRATRMNLSASLSNLPPLQEAQSPMNDSAAWKDEVSARVRAHRSGRSRVPENQPALPGMETVAPSAIAARVAERYARVPSWREAMAAEAASQAAAAAAAAQPPQPKAEAPAPPSPPRRAKSATPRKTAPQLDFSPPRAEKIVEAPHPYQPDLIRYSVSSDSLPAPRSTPAQARAHAAALPVERNDGLLDPLEDAIVEPTRLLPARVIE